MHRGAGQNTAQRRDVPSGRVAGEEGAADVREPALVVELAVVIAAAAGGRVAPLAALTPEPVMEKAPSRRGPGNVIDQEQTAELVLLLLHRSAGGLDNVKHLSQFRRQLNLFSWSLWLSVDLAVFIGLDYATLSNNALEHWNGCAQSVHQECMVHNLCIPMIICAHLMFTSCACSLPITQIQCS